MSPKTKCNTTDPLYIDCGDHGTCFTYHVFNDEFENRCTCANSYIGQFCNRYHSPFPLEPDKENNIALICVLVLLFIFVVIFVSTCTYLFVRRKLGRGIRQTTNGIDKKLISYKAEVNQDSVSSEKKLSLETV